LEHKKGYLFLAVSWTLFIAYLCLTDFNKLPTIKIGGLDKSVHFILHFFFTLFWYLYLKSTQKIRNHLVIVVIIASVLYGSLIEVAQGLFTTTRKSDVMDVLANSVGTTGACLVIYLMLHFSKKQTQINSTKK
jgi:VanZ family protein